MKTKTCIMFLMTILVSAQIFSCSKQNEHAQFVNSVNQYLDEFVEHKQRIENIESSISEIISTASFNNYSSVEEFKERWQNEIILPIQQETSKLESILPGSSELEQIHSILVEAVKAMLSCANELHSNIKLENYKEQIEEFSGKLQENYRTMFSEYRAQLNDLIKGSGLVN